MPSSSRVEALLNAYSFHNSKLFSELSQDDIAFYSQRYELDPGERIWAFYSHAVTKFNPKHGVLLTDRRLVALTERVVEEVVVESFPWDELLLVLGDISVGAIVSRLHLPDGRTILFTNDASKFKKLLNKIMPEITEQSSQFGEIVTEQHLSDRRFKQFQLKENPEGLSKRQRSSFKRYLVWGTIGSVAVILAVGALTMPDKGQFTDGEVCRAGVSTIMGKPLSIVSVRWASDHYRLSYIRRVDNTRWNLRCEVRRGKVIWASETGPWRTRPGDAPVYWRVNESGNVLTIREVYDDGSVTSKTYAKGAF